MGITKVRSRCPQCGKGLRVEPRMLGTTVRCPACREMVLIPKSGFPDPGIQFIQRRDNRQVRSDRPIEADDTGMNSALNVETAVGPKAAKGPSPPPLAGKLGRFELFEVLGRGGFGIVYRAHDSLLDREIALKVPLFAMTEKIKAQRFLNEAKAAAQLRHPNIVTVYEAGQADGRLYLAAEYVKGETLAERIEKERPAFEQTVIWCRELASTLAYAHQQGIVHRDIKPHNVMIGHDGRPQIMDFGLAKRLDVDSKMTSEGTLLGTPAYMSPEQARGEIERVGPASDQYSLGSVFYELITGQRPFDGPPAMVIAKVTIIDPLSPRKVNSKIPRDLEAICQKAMEKHPANRYANMTAMADDLMRWERGDATIARPWTMLQRTRRWIRRSPAFAALTFVFTAILILAVTSSSVGAYMLIRSNLALNMALENARIQSQKATAEADRAQLAVETTRQKTKQAQVETLSANQSQLANKKALDELQAEIDRRTTVENELKLVGSKRNKAAAEVAKGETESKQTAALVAGFGMASSKESWNQYSEKVKAAQDAIQEGDFTASRKALEACNEKLRGWEWRFLKSCVDHRHNLNPTIISVPNDSARGPEIYSCQAISADGSLLACSMPTIKRMGSRVTTQTYGLVDEFRVKQGDVDEVQIVRIAQGGQAEVITRIDLSAPAFASFGKSGSCSFSKDGNWLCIYISESNVIVRCPIGPKHLRVSAARLKQWSVPTDNNSGIGQQSLNSTIALSNSKFAIFNSQYPNIESPLFLPYEALVCPDKVSVVAVDRAGSITLSRYREPAPLLTFSYRLVQSEVLGANRVQGEWRVFWSADGSRLIVAEENALCERVAVVFDAK